MIGETAGWIRGRQGRRASHRWFPALGPVRGIILFVPPWGDEMNHTRPLMAAGARALAAAGWEVRCHDPYGTGDSDGEFMEATLRGWCEDLADDVVEAGYRGPVVVWTARQGALLVPPLLAELKQRRKRAPAAVVSWSPVTSGAAALTQWLRIAAMGGDERLESLRARLEAGESLLAAGYPLTPAFAREVAALDAVAKSATDPHERPVDTPRRQAWDAIALGLTRFWLETEAPLEVALVSPLVDWLERNLPAVHDSEVTLVGLQSPAEPGEGCSRRGTAHHPWPLQLTVPVGAAGRPGVLFVVGGPQTRVGAHRQFLRWARAFADAGHATCRFDRSGRGDAEGPRLAPEQAGNELRAALEQAVDSTSVKRWVVFGLCDGATAALLHLADHPAVAGLLAVNPWIAPSTAVASQALVDGHYARRWRDAGFWKRVLRGEVPVGRALGEWLGHQARAWRGKRTTRPAGESGRGLSGERRGTVDVPSRLLAAVERSTRPMLWVLSGRDRTAAEFRALVLSSPAWQAALARAGHERHTLEEADHTLSEPRHHDQLAALALDWLTRVA